MQTVWSSRGGLPISAPGGLPAGWAGHSRVIVSLSAAAWRPARMAVPPPAGRRGPRHAPSPESPPGSTGVARAAQPLRSRGQRSNGRRRFHLHLHGVTAEDIAAILGPGGTAGTGRAPARPITDRGSPRTSRRRGLPGTSEREKWPGGQFPATGRRDSQRRAPCSCYTPGSAPPLAAGPVPHRPAPRRRRDRCLPAHVQIARLPPTPVPAPRSGCRGSRQPPVPHRGRDCRHNISGTLRPCKACGKPW